MGRSVSGLIVALILAAAAGSGRTAAQSCSFTVSTPAMTFGDQGAHYFVAATASAACTWTASTSAPWITTFAPPAGQPPSLSMSIGLNVDPNTSGVVRTATIFINGQAAVYVIQRTNACVSGLNPSSIQTTSAGAARTTNLLTDDPNCVWSVGNFPAWVAFPSPLGGIGPTTVSFNFIPNLTGPARSGDLSFGGAVLHIEQAAGSMCVFSTAPTDIDMPAKGGSRSFQITGVGTDCTYSALSLSNHVTITSGASGTAPAAVAFTVGPAAFVDEILPIQVQNATFRIHQNGPPLALEKGSVNMIVALGPNGVRQKTASTTSRITNREEPHADFTVTPDKPWAVVTPSGAQTPAVLTLDIDPAQVALLGPGSYTSNAKLISPTAPLSPTTVTTYLTVIGADQTWQPFGVFETPHADDVQSGAIGVTGWALDLFGIRRVSIYRDPVATEPSGLVFIGDATRVRGARPDVIPWSLASDRDRAGWGYMLLSNVLPGGGNGRFTLHAYVDNTDGQRILLGSRTVTVNNAAATRPFGTIDEPAQGAMVSGTLVNRGWVLTPNGKTIPIDGSTIKVYIDGALVGPVAEYNRPRPDVKAFFPNLGNSNGPEARLSIDTTTLADGVHTIAWGVIDDAGAAEGIGSRYFTVQNGSSSLVDAPDTSRAAAAMTRMPVLKTDTWSRAGVDETGWATRVVTDAKGNRTVSALAGERFELFLDPTLAAPCGTYEGHLMSGDVAGPLPTGASLDAQHGIFRWQVGAELAGNFAFVFVQRGCDGAERRIPVTVTVSPPKQP